MTAKNTLTGKRPTRAELDADLVRYEAESKLDWAKASELMEADPQLPAISAYIIARDMRSADRSLEWLREGKYEWGVAEAFTGSYGRLDLRVRALAEGLITTREAYTDLAETWSSGDPDDTDPRFLALWRKAFAANGRRILRDRPGSKLGGTILTLYRGQDEGAPFGISWSLDRRVAERFAHGAATRQSHRGGVVYMGKVPRAAAMGYMVGRNEAEVIIDPKSLLDITIV